MFLIKYMGSKSRISKFIVPIIQKYIEDNNIKNYLEPFVGGANVIDKVKCKNKIGGDNNEYLIEMFRNLDKISTLPKEISKEEYSKVRNCYNESLDIYEKWYIGAVGFLSSYNGRFFDGGYSGKRTNSNGMVRDYYDESKRNLEKQIPNLKNIRFIHTDYKRFDSFPNKAVIYCDIPYANTKQYNTSKGFNYEDFWEWAREMSKYHIVLISEINAPNDFKCIWEQNILRTINTSKREISTEKLFKYII